MGVFTFKVGKILGRRYTQILMVTRMSYINRIEPKNSIYQKLLFFTIQNQLRAGNYLSRICFIYVWIYEVFEFGRIFRYGNRTHEAFNLNCKLIGTESGRGFSSPLSTTSYNLREFRGVSTHGNLLNRNCIQR